MRRWMLGFGLVLVAGCGTLPAGMLPDGLTPAITLDPLRDQLPAAPLRPPVPNVPAPQPTRAPGLPTPGPTTRPVATPVPVGTPSPAATLDTLEATVLRLTNEQRTQQGLASLAAQPTLMTIARGRSQDMAVRNYFDHTNPDGKLVFDLMKAAGYVYRSAGENIAYNNYPVSSSATEVVKAWMNSSGHRANILNTKYGRLGVGAWVRSDGRIYFTQVFSD